MTNPMITSGTEGGRALASIATVLNARSTRNNRWALAGPGITNIARGIIEPGALQVIASGGVMFTMHQSMLQAPSAEDDRAVEELRRSFAAGFPAMNALWADDRFNDRPAAARAFRVAFLDVQTVMLHDRSGSGQAPSALRVVRPIGAYLVELALSVEHVGTSAERALHRANARQLLEFLQPSGVTTELESLRERGVDVKRFYRWHAALANELDGYSPRGFGGRVRTAVSRGFDYLRGTDIDAESAKVIRHEFRPKSEPGK